MKRAETMDKKNGSPQPAMPKEKRFFAKRVKNWVMYPENDPEFTEEIRNGKYPGLEILLEDDGIHARGNP